MWRRLSRQRAPGLIPRAVAALASTDDRERGNALGWLDGRAIGEHQGAVVKLARDPEFSIRKAAVVRLTRAAQSGFVDRTTVRDAVWPLLSGWSSDIDLAVDALRDLGAEWTDAMGRDFAAVVMRCLGGEVAHDSARDLLKLVDDKSAAAMPTEDVARLIDAVDAAVVSGRLAHLGSGMAGRLIDALVGSLARRDPDDAVSAIEGLLSVRYAELRRELVAALGELDGAASTRLLAELTANDEATKSAYHHLEARGFADVSRLPRLADHLRTGDAKAIAPAVRIALAGDGDRALEALRVVLARASAGGGRGLPVEEVLGRIVDLAGTDAKADLVDAMTIGSSRISKAAQRRFVELFGLDGVGELARLQVDESIRLHPDDFADDELDRFVREVGPDQVSIALLSQAPRLNVDGSRALMRKALESSDPEVQENACRLAGIVGTDEDLPALRSLLDEGSLDVRSFAGSAISMLEGRAARESAARLFGPDERVEALRRAVELTRSEDPTVRRGAAHALAALGDAAAVPRLLDLLGDDDAAVREAAAQALGRLGATTPGDGA